MTTKIDFPQLRRDGESFVATGRSFDAYLAWAAQPSCDGCGKRRADLPRDAAGNVLEMWRTETLCWACAFPEGDSR